MGVAKLAITDRSETILELANYADKALYYAKNAGKNAIYQLVYGEIDGERTGASYVRIEY